MEWKEHVAWLSPMLATAAAFIVLYYGNQLIVDKRLRWAASVVEAQPAMDAGGDCCGGNGRRGLWRHLPEVLRPLRAGLMPRNVGSHHGAHRQGRPRRAAPSYHPRLA